MPWAEPAGIIHAILGHRWYMPEAAGRDTGTTAAARSCSERALPQVPVPPGATRG